MTTGNRISQLRKNKGYTQEYVAQCLDVSRQAVFKWEKDQTRPDTANLIALAELLDTGVEYLINGTPPKTDNSGERYFRASLIPLFLILLCWIIGLLSGVYTDMVQIPLGNGIRMGVPFLMYGPSPFAIVLVSVGIVSFLLLLVLLFLGHQAHKS